MIFQCLRLWADPLRIEHLKCELDRFISACAEQNDAFALQPYVDQLGDSKARRPNANAALQQVQARIA